MAEHNHEVDAFRSDNVESPATETNVHTKETSPEATRPRSKMNVRAIAIVGAIVACVLVATGYFLTTTIKKNRAEERKRVLLEIKDVEATTNEITTNFRVYYKLAALYRKAGMDAKADACNEYGDVIQREMKFAMRNKLAAADRATRLERERMLREKEEERLSHLSDEEGMPFVGTNGIVTNEEGEVIDYGRRDSMYETLVVEAGVDVETITSNALRSGEVGVEVEMTNPASMGVLDGVQVMTAEPVTIGGAPAETIETEAPASTPEPATSTPETTESSPKPAGTSEAVPSESSAPESESGGVTGIEPVETESLTVETIETDEGETVSE